MISQRTGSFESKMKKEIHKMNSMLDIVRVCKEVQWYYNRGAGKCNIPRPMHSYNINYIWLYNYKDKKNYG